MEPKDPIGTALVRTRASDMTQKRLASMLGTTQQQVARWERTLYRGARLASVSAVAGALGLALDVRVPVAATPLAAESPAVYSVFAVASPARDLADVIGRIRANARFLRERFGLRALAVYGSFASGSQRGSSDVDLLAEFDTATFAREMGTAAALQEILGRRVDLATQVELRPELRERVLAEIVRVIDA